MQNKILEFRVTKIFLKILNVLVELHFVYISEERDFYFQFLWVSSIPLWLRHSFVLTGCLQLLLRRLYGSIGPERDADTFGFSDRIFRDTRWRYYWNTILLHVGAIKRLLKVEHGDVRILQKRNVKYWRLNFILSIVTRAVKITPWLRDPLIWRNYGQKTIKMTDATEFANIYALLLIFLSASYCSARFKSNCCLLW